MTSTVPSRTLAEVAAEGAECILTTSSWLHRRVDKVSYVSPGMICRDISVDFSIPGGYPAFREGGTGRPTYFVPIHLLRKWPPLMRFDLRSENGRPIPLLTSAKNRALDAAVLASVAPAGELLDAVREDLTAVAESSPAVAERKLDAVALAIARKAPGLAPEERQRWFQVLLLASSLVANSLLWARVDAYPRERQIVKLRFEEPFATDLSIFRRVILGMSWTSQRARVRIPNIGDGGSYHLQFDPPLGTHVLRARLRVRNPLRRERLELAPRKRDRLRWLGVYVWRGWNTFRVKVGSALRLRSAPHPGAPSSPEPPPGEPYETWTRHRAYLYVSGPRPHRGTADIDLAPDKGGLVVGAVAMVAMIAAFLTFFAATAEEVVENLAPAVTSLLFVPALLGYLVTRPLGEHAIRRSQVVGIRLVLLAAGFLPVAAAIALIAAGETPPYERVQGWWTGFAVGGWCLTALLAGSWLLPAVDDPAGARRPWLGTPPPRRYKDDA